METAQSPAQTSFFWPSSKHADTALRVWLLIAAVVGMAMSGSITGGVINAGAWYLIVILVRAVFIAGSK